MTSFAQLTLVTSGTYQGIRYATGTLSVKD